jgi:hypothetical protein
VPLAQSRFDVQGRLSDPATRDIVEQSLRSFVQYLTEQHTVRERQPRPTMVGA